MNTAPCWIKFVIVFVGLIVVAGVVAALIDRDTESWDD